MHLGDGALATGCASNCSNTSDTGRPKERSSWAWASAVENGGTCPAAAPARPQCRRQQVAPGGQHLADLTNSGPGLQREAQAHRARLGEPAPEQHALHRHQQEARARVASTNSSRPKRMPTLMIRARRRRRCNLDAYRIGKGDFNAQRGQRRGSFSPAPRAVKLSWSRLRSVFPAARDRRATGLRRPGIGALRGTGQQRPLLGPVLDKVLRQLFRGLAVPGGEALAFADHALGKHIAEHLGQSSARSQRKWRNRYCTVPARSALPSMPISPQHASSPRSIAGSAPGPMVTTSSARRPGGGRATARSRGCPGARPRAAGRIHALPGVRLELVARPGFRIEQMVEREYPPGCVSTASSDAGRSSAIAPAVWPASTSACARHRFAGSRLPRTIRLRIGALADQCGETHAGPVSVAFVSASSSSALRRHHVGLLPDGAVLQQVLLDRFEHRVGGEFAQFAQFALSCTACSLPKLSLAWRRKPRCRSRRGYSPALRAQKPARRRGRRRRSRRGSLPMPAYCDCPRPWAG